MAKRSSTTSRTSVVSTEVRTAKPAARSEHVAPDPSQKADQADSSEAGMTSAQTGGSSADIHTAAVATSDRPAGEVYRKALHMLPGLLPFMLGAIPHPDPLGALAVAHLVVICVILTVVFLRLHRVVRRPGEENFISTAVSYPATILATVVLFPAQVEFAAVVVVVLAFGDSAAYIGGKRFGKTPLPWNPDKTWIGTVSFVCVAAPLAALAYWTVADNPQVPFALAILCGVSATVAGAVAESLPMRITDNLRVGVAAAVGVVAAHFAFAGF